jgi:hypothetical protein
MELHNYFFPEHYAFYQNFIKHMMSIEKDDLKSSTEKAGKGEVKLFACKEIINRW